MTKESTGLTNIEAQRRLEKYGPNDVLENKLGVAKKFLEPLYSPISLMLLAAAALSRFNGNFFDFYFILALYFVNYAIQKWQEFKADRAIKELQKKLSFDVWTMRDSKWIFVNARLLVAGDHIRLGLGSVIPADGVIIASKNLSVNEAVLTGESLPKEKKEGDKIYSGSFVSAGNLEARITATGKNTNFGKTIFSIEPPSEKSILEKDILYITRFLTAISMGAVVILTVGLALKGFSLASLLTLDISLVIAGIPIALPAVMAIILSIGATGLAQKMVVIRRLSALQDLANVNLLLTDKTGTLTKNEIEIVNVVSYRREFNTDDIVELAYQASSSETPDAIDMAVAKRFSQTGRPKDDAELVHFIPYDSDRKRSTALLREKDGDLLISMGAPQVIRAFDEMLPHGMASKFENDIEQAAAGGFRTLAIAIKAGGGQEQNMEIAGMLFLADPLYESSKDTLRFMQSNGISVKMVTGDNRLIAERVAKELGLQGEVVSGKETKKICDNKDVFMQRSAAVAAFAEIMPQDKCDLVRVYRQNHIVASTGDGINDLPALKTANVGIAVAGAVSTLKSQADIVLLGSGLAVIKDAIMESRKIFTRLYNYSIYRISESFRLIMTILFLGLWIGFYPLEPLQLILLAFLNDIPIISLATDRVKISTKPSQVKTKERFILSILFGSVGVINSIILFFLMRNAFHFALPVIQTMFFLKLTVSGHMLIFVAHTPERWYKFLPSKEVMIATLFTQVLATMLAVTGFMMSAPVPVWAAGFVWLWALCWMQVSESAKLLKIK